jgi:hypothetical protein
MSSYIAAQRSVETLRVGIPGTLVGFLPFCVGAEVDAYRNGAQATAW